ncbi:WXG100 family type VII secretion target [Sporichthya polymorpha]|uniref:WXG100 family type VII secretion target n=1 Tax=Sporichthya polymorpha TaxID=35751 RepID=UPI0003A90326|nr:hypothetical protein [Sporichthya polymorpha]
MNQPADADPQVLLDLLVRTREDVERDRVALAAATWEKVVAELNRIADGLDPHQGETFRHSWQGRAADAATAAFDRIATAAREHARQAQSVADALRSGEAAVNDVSHKVFTEIGTKLQAKKRGGLFGGVADWVEDRFDDQPDVDRDEQIQRIHAAYGEFIGAMQTHTHSVAAEFSTHARSDNQINEGFVAANVSQPASTPATELGATTRPSYRASSSSSPARSAVGSTNLSPVAITQHVGPGPLSEAFSAASSLRVPTSADPSADSNSHLGLLGGGAAALGAAGIAAGAAYGLARGQSNAARPASAGASPPGVLGGSSARSTAGPVLGGATGSSPGNVPVTGGTTSGAFGPGARTPASPGAGMVGAIGGSPPAGGGAKGPSTRYGPAPTLAEDSSRPAPQARRGPRRPLRRIPWRSAAARRAG